MEEDKKLYKEFIDGKPEAFERIVIKYKKNLIYFITRYVKNIEIAEDIFQEVILYILENKEKYNSEYSLKTFMYIIAKSKALNYIKHDKYIKNVKYNEIIEESQLIEDVIYSREIAIEIRKNINKLPRKYQIVLYLTQLDGISYKETAKIMDKTEKQIKTLVYNAKKKLKQILIKEKIIKIDINKKISILCIFIIIAVATSGITYASVKIYESIKGKATLYSTYTNKINKNDKNSVWTPSFQLAWNELMDCIEGKIIFDVQNEPTNLLNEKIFTKDMLQENEYYIKIGRTTEEFRKEVQDEVRKKFNINVLDNVSFNREDEEHYTIYVLFMKKFEFLIPFDKLESGNFNNSEEKVEYFGINSMSDEKLNNNVEVLFYNNENDFCIKLKTRENDELILYRTDSCDSFETAYGELLQKSVQYTGEKNFNNKEDILKIPKIQINTVNNYNELCNVKIKNMKQMYIANALQDVNFSLNEKGGNVESEAGIYNKLYTVAIDGRKFVFSDKFIIFMKKSNSELPFFSLKIDDTNILNTK